MKKLIIYFALLTISLVSATTAFADVKIKSKQTMSGQSFENTIYIKGKRQRTERNMGSMQMIDLTQCDLKRSVQLNPAAKTYLLNLFNQETEDTNQKVSAGANGKMVRAGGTVTSTVTSKDTGERRKMFGYEARRIITMMETVSSPDVCAVANSKMQIDGWYIDAAFALDCETDRFKNGYVPQQTSGCQDKYEMKTIGNAKRGYPVYEKMSFFDGSGKEMSSILTEVVELSQAALDTSLFEIPEDYREVKDSSEIYGVSATSAISMANSGSNSVSGMTNDSNDDISTPQNSGSVSALQNQTSMNNSAEVGAKKPGIVRIGIITKSGSVGEGINGAELAAAINNTLGEYVKGTKVEIIPLQAKLVSLVENEAKQKECDFILFANVSHKKGGGGGFGGMFGKAAGGMLGGVIPMGSNVGSVIAGQVASTVITAAAMSGSFKSKDEITLDIKMQQTGGAAVLSQQFKAKAKSNGEDIISQVVEQAATAIVNKAG